MRDAARKLYDEGYAPIPLGLDANGFAKRPLIKGWPMLPHDWEILKALPWKDAKGIGLVLGNGLAVIDVDDEELAAAMFAYLMRQHALPRFVWTVRKHCHIYLRPSENAASRFFKYEWEGRTVSIEFKAQGNQVACPPTPGYTLAEDVEPFKCKTIDQAARPLFAAMGMVLLDEEKGGGYPKPWAEQVPEGSRNKSIYVEAHQLREAGMELEAALPVLRARFDNDYEGQWSSDMEKTIRSAYQKGVVPGIAPTDPHGPRSDDAPWPPPAGSYDVCRDCAQPAEMYTNSGVPFCEDHGEREPEDKTQEVGW